jgi:leucyl-tRNA synthetase
MLGREGGLTGTAWPEGDPALAAEAVVEVVLQVNGKVRGHISVPRDLSKDELEAHARQDEKIRAFTGDGEIRKVIVVPNKLVNLVVSK